jgi:hypothetical protein
LTPAKVPAAKLFRWIQRTTRTRTCLPQYVRLQKMSPRRTGDRSLLQNRDRGGRDLERGQRLGHGSGRLRVPPHLNADYSPMADMGMMERTAAKLDYPLYAIDDETAIKIVDREVEVVSEGEWRMFDGSSDIDEAEG